MFLFWVLGPLLPYQGQEISRGSCQGTGKSALICNCYFYLKIHRLVVRAVCLLAAEDEGLFKCCHNRPVVFTLCFEFVVPWQDLIICFLHHFDGTTTPKHLHRSYPYHCLLASQNPAMLHKPVLLFYLNPIPKYQRWDSYYVTAVLSELPLLLS